ncbi:Hypothetical protein SMAX5B_014316 [Scophthalmus maximus]|uniref:Uncharacterized protein n=1 Tax=Scophthalmus maximus TaxID=52904 RepID=A0A2U9BHP7_SCOMX|nr:Hypothetical protein SMAX5B_014316 [Scophthalmus maximus]
MERGVPTLSVVLKSNAGRSSATPRLLQLRVYHNVRPHGTELYDELYNRPSGSRSAPRGANADVTEVNAELHFRHHGLIPADPLPDHRKSGQLLLNRTLSSQWATGNVVTLFGRRLCRQRRREWKTCHGFNEERCLRAI